MTAITMLCDKASNVIKGFEIRGHAGAADYGSDIVCASISVLAINTQNAIERFCEDEFEQSADKKDGSMKFLIKDLPGHDASLLLAAAYLGFEEIAKEYDDFVSMEIKEV
ncbi:MAG: ribosomal-processing cysteine protease Prp [Lachnospiraceae bacterium]